jgi:hypothetical protein
MSVIIVSYARMTLQYVHKIFATNLSRRMSWEFGRLATKKKNWYSISPVAKNQALQTNIISETRDYSYFED